MCVCMCISFFLLLLFFFLLFFFFSLSYYLFKPSNYIITNIVTIMFINITVLGVLEKSSWGELQARNSSGMVYPYHNVKWWISRFKGAYRTHASSEVELFVILAAFGLLYVTESSVLGAVRVLHVFRHFVIIVIFIIIITIIVIVIVIIIIIVIVVIAIIINDIFITFIIIRLLEFLIKSSLLFLWGKLKVCVCFLQFLLVS